MDRITFLRSVILETIEDYIRAFASADKGISYKPVTDEARHQYQLVLHGWQGHERIYHVVFHLDIIGGKIWVQEDNTEDGIAELLLQKGLSKKDIVLAFYSEAHRKHTEFAVS